MEVFSLRSLDFSVSRIVFFIFPKKSTIDSWMPSKEKIVRKIKIKVVQQGSLLVLPIGDPSMYVFYIQRNGEISTTNTLASRNRAKCRGDRCRCVVHPKFAVRMISCFLGRVDISYCGIIARKTVLHRPMVPNKFLLLEILC